jgi:hypothetical protein
MRSPTSVPIRTTAGRSTSPPSRGSNGSAGPTTPRSARWTTAARRSAATGATSPTGNRAPKGPAWLHLRDRDGDRYVRLAWPADEALAEHAPVFRNADRELWWLAPEQGPELPEVLHRLDNPLRESDPR